MRQDRGRKASRPGCAGRDRERATNFGRWPCGVYFGAGGLRSGVSDFKSQIQISNLKFQILNFQILNSEISNLKSQISNPGSKSQAIQHRDRYCLPGSPRKPQAQNPQAINVGSTTNICSKNAITSLER